MSEQLSRGLAALIEDEGRAFADTDLGGHPESGVAAVGRARRRRSAGYAATSVASVAVIAAAVAGPLALRGEPTTVAPASGSPSPSASAAKTTTATETGAADAASLWEDAQARTQEDPTHSDEAQAALACTWGEGDDPRDLPLTGVVASECPAVWVGDAPLIYVDTTLRREGSGDAIVVGWDIVNLSDETLTLDDQSVAVLLEVAPGDRGTTVPEVAMLTMAADDLWFTSTDRATVQSSDSRLAELAPGASLQGETRVSEFAGATLDTSALTRALAGDSFSVAVQVRLPGAGEGRDLMLEDQSQATYTLDP
ncbi:hypothetical protein [Demequina sp. NBRC 110057]|uniref:hypothetical protein n=1 Tax=Demequina sp. NBRC 110057 TaxID=1570346 RepID=UPI00135643BD|nr:hypothetical protein [Demequina sp. NBRC 110057]